MRSWYEGLLKLLAETGPCPGFSRGEWETVRANALHFLDRFGEEAVRLGWTTEHLFAVHPRMGVVRLDYCGALMTGVLGQAVGVTATTIRGRVLTARRDTPGKVWGVPVWEYRPPEAVKPAPLPGWAPAR